MYSHRLVVLGVLATSIYSVQSWCQADNGQRGICMPTSPCARKNGISEPGHCPGPIDYQVPHPSPPSTPQLTPPSPQCCTFGTCTAAGIPGWYQPHSACSGTSHAVLPHAHQSDVFSCTYGTCDSKGGTCQPVDTCDGTSYAEDLCPGPNAIQCCVAKKKKKPTRPECDGSCIVRPRRRDHPYEVVEGNGEWTVGWGHRCSEPKCAEISGCPVPDSTIEALFNSDLHEAERCVTMNTLACVSLTHSQYGALVSVAFKHRLPAIHSVRPPENAEWLHRRRRRHGWAVL
ncbi:hypothetical protein P152DRAFT_484581 [Eremomyces bilateralis CBS 781.70]|uniref:Uncharacterized protein n=1 Tax=Eremomyces bilateralis CBS 781.70 TaxID=1392243 RepID=A0A6G1FUQ0_9PEZI|nr:uncharacterized protein P152DRAFT_484581 [Eremomyces bilateralis CBS 781.70]KAF1809483.1 hypothetical protein P152DRAFT_484581 [Eremomyces bilateralis CBS 781.70]